ncbi:hypothetical protein G9A89_010514 [Geosiphon pyriformis]|nr:hypothetical protein G9A89_010514 [Geosiphon pyriformis]
MTEHGWHRYFDDNDVSNWSIFRFHETWICQNKDDPKNLRYQKANDVPTKKVELKKQGAAKLLANKAAIAHAKRNQLFADPLNAFLDAWLVTMPICGKRNRGTDIDGFWTLIEYKNLEKAALSKLNCQQVRIHSKGHLLSKTDVDSTPDKQNMHSKIVCYLNAMENLLKYNRVVSDVPPVWTKSLEFYLDNVLRKEGDEFKIAAMEKINGDEGNYFRLYCEKILTDFYNLV